MAYLFELNNGQKVYVENQGQQTIVTSMIVSPGQQQQASNSFTTGSWITSPEAFVTPMGMIVKITTAQGESLIQIQGSSMQVTNQSPPGSNFPKVQIQQVSQVPSSSMQPMQPMQPMTMGNMSMNMNPMEMRMGNMEMRMGEAKTSSSTKRFCSQCGAAVRASDRFCSSCGSSLQ